LRDSSADYNKKTVIHGQVVADKKYTPSLFGDIFTANNLGEIQRKTEKEKT